MSSIIFSAELENKCFMEIIFIIGVTQSLFLAFLVYSKKNKSLADYVLTVWFILIALNLLDYYFAISGFAKQHHYLLSLGTCIPLLHGPLMLLYIVLLIKTEVNFKWVYLLHILPFCFFIIYLFFNFYILDLNGKLSFYEQQNLDPNPFIEALIILKIITGPIYVVFSFFMLKNHTKNIKSIFSYTEEINLIWIRYVLGGIGFVWLMVLFSKIMSNFNSSFAEMEDHLIYISLTLVMFILGYFGIKQQKIYSGTFIENNKSKINVPGRERYKKSSLRETDSQEYRNNLLDYMENEKPYLYGKISLNEIASHLNIPVNHLSQVINEQLGKNYFDFVNEYRVREVKKQFENLKDDKISILAVAYQSGFNSKSGFNIVFKKYTGLTPSQYIKNNDANIQ